MDGEGSFTAYIRNPEDTTPRMRRVKIEPRFYVKLVARDRVVLEQFKKFFKCGNVYFQGDKRQNHQDCYRYEVANRKDLVEIISPFFKENKLRFPSRRMDFDLFCDIVGDIYEKPRISKREWARLYNFKLKMH